MDRPKAGERLFVVGPFDVFMAGKRSVEGAVNNTDIGPRTLQLIGEGGRVMDQVDV